MASREYTKDQKESCEPESNGERPKHKPQGREHQVHKEILERRMRGGPEPTPEAYARALEQWHKLPGSIVRPPTDVIPSTRDEPAESADVEGSKLSESKVNEPNDKEER